MAFGAFLPNSFSNRPESEVRHYLQNASVKVVAKVVVSQDGLQAFYNLLKNYFERKSEKGEQEK